MLSCQFNKPNQYVFRILELPWDEPREKCSEFLDWLKCKLINSPWTKIDPTSLSIINVLNAVLNKT